MPLLDDETLELAPSSLERSESCWMERSNAQLDSDVDPSSDDEVPIMEDGGYTSDDEKEDRIVVGEATFSVAGQRVAGLELTLERHPELFVASAEHRVEEEEDISGNQALQLELLKRLPLKGEKSWSEVVQTLADEYKRTHPKP